MALLNRGTASAQITHGGAGRGDAGGEPYRLDDLWAGSRDHHGRHDQRDGAGARGRPLPGQRR